ncbi:MAG: cellulose biosynthesis cyclic di-GMP-binding regulatory protein BcsB [Gallionella sp.]
MTSKAGMNRGLRTQMGVAMVIAALLCSMLSLSAEAKTRKDDTVIQLGTEDASQNKVKLRVVNYSLKQMGAQKPVMLRGVEGSMLFPFSIRSDEVVVGAKLKLSYNYSPSMLPELSHLMVMMNDEVVHVLALPHDKDKGDANRTEFDIDPRFFTDFNKLKFKLIGHYTYKCEDPMHSSLWLELSNLGVIELTLAPLTLENDLKLLPLPFFDRRDNANLDLPFVFSAAPSLGTLKAAGVTASWFGGLASYRGARFPVTLDKLPEGNAVVFLQSNEHIGTLSGSNGASVSLLSHPTVPGAKLLLVSGSNDEEMLRAARAITLNHKSLTGQHASISESTEPPARKPYDAPSWLPTDRPVRFGELAKLDDLQVHGYFNDPIKLDFRIPPDLFTWRSAGVPVDLKYRYTNLPYNKSSSLNIDINNRFVQAMALNDFMGDGSITEKTAALLRDGEEAKREESVLIPPYQLIARNQLQLNYYFDMTKEGECRDNYLNNMQGSIDADSTLDFSQFPHYAPLPDLAAFANLGFPYTRMADLSDSAVVLPAQPNAGEIGLYLSVMGHMGESTGYPALRHTLVSSADIDQVSKDDLIVIASSQHQDLLHKWADYLPIVEQDGERHVREPNIFKRLYYRWAGLDTLGSDHPEAKLSFKGGSSLATIMAFESPLHSKRSAVVMYADDASDLTKIGDIFYSRTQIADMQGDFIILDNKNVVNARVSDTYYVGDLDWYTKLRWLITQHPIIAVLLGLLIAILLAVLMYRMLRKIAAKRLSTKH